MSDHYDRYSGMEKLLGTDTIYRQAAIDAVSDVCFELRGVFGRCEDALKALPSAQPERKTGKWNMCYDDDAPQDGIWFCSVCGYARFVDDISPQKFCPNCGADMRGENDETD